MRPFITIVSLLLFASCVQTTEKTDKAKTSSEEQKRRFYRDNFAFSGRDFEDRRETKKSFQSFMDEQYPDLKAKNKYDPFIYALDEQYVDTNQLDESKHWFRITVKPSFSNPYCLILFKENKNCFLTTKATNGIGGYYTGTLAVQLNTQLNDTFYDYTLQSLENIQFWKLPMQDTTCGPGLDGETWTFELLDQGKYKIFSRWSPEFCGDSLTRKLAQIGIKLTELSKLDKVLTASGQQSGM